MTEREHAIKKLVGEKAADFIDDGMIIGLGSGSTVYWTIKRLGELVKQGLDIKGIPSSRKTETLAMKFGVPLTSFSEYQSLDIAIDGADEVDSQLNLIKGGGGSLVREKIVNAASSKLIIIVDNSKVVSQLGKFPLPVEIVPFGWEATTQNIAALGCRSVLRYRDSKPFISDNGNYIVDCDFNSILNPNELHTRLVQIVGVVETGLFCDMTDILLIGGVEGVKVVSKN